MTVITQETFSIEGYLLRGYNIYYIKCILYNMFVGNIKMNEHMYMYLCMWNL